MRYWMFLLGLLMYANVAEAIDCQTPPDCKSLGYSTEDDPNCADDGYMYCPFNHDYKKCVNYDCAALGFTTSDKTSWCKEIIKCQGNEDYTLCNEKIIPLNCEVGDVYYADGSCGKVTDYVKDSSPKPVGVVYYISDGGAHGKVINLHDLGRASSTANFAPTYPYSTYYKYFTWGVSTKDIPDLTNWTCNGNTDYLTVAKTGNHEDAFWSAGKSYTDLIVKALESRNLQYAAGAAHAFYPPEVSEKDPKVGKGKWYLPTLGELMDLHGYDYNNVGTTCESSTGATGTTKSTVNATLQALKDKSAGNAEKLAGDGYWSSSEYNQYYSWALDMDDGFRVNHQNKATKGFCVRASLQF